MRRIREPGRVRGLCERAAASELAEGVAEPQPEQVAPDRQPRLFPEEVTEATFGEPDGRGEFPERSLPSGGRVDEREHSSDSRVDRRRLGTLHTDGREDRKRYLTSAAAVEYAAAAVGVAERRTQLCDRGRRARVLDGCGEDSRVLSLGVEVEAHEDRPAAVELVREVRRDHDRAPLDQRARGAEAHAKALVDGERDLECVVGVQGRLPRAPRKERHAFPRIDAASPRAHASYSTPADGVVASSFKPPMVRSAYASDVNTETSAERVVNTRRVLSYFVYPVIVLGGGAAIVWALGAGLPSAVAVGAVTIAGAVGVTALERLLPYEPSWNRSAGDAAADATHYVVNLATKQSALALYGALVARAGVFAEVWPRSWPLAAQALVALVVVDVCLYSVHRLSHANHFLWRLHAVHHASRRLYWVNGEKRHPLHQILEGLPGVTALMLVGAPQAALVAALGILGLNMMLQHGNVAYRAGWLRYVFSVAELHRWHHRRSADESRVNFGAFFAVWDVVLGTYFNDPHTAPVREVGVDELPAVPDDYTGQLAWPFRSKETERPG